MFFARWIALVRFAAAWLAGINHMRFREFFFWNALGGISWGVTYGLVGYFAGSAAADAISTFGLYAFGALLVLFLAYLYFHCASAAASARSGRRCGPSGRRRRAGPTASARGRRAGLGVTLDAVAIRGGVELQRAGVHAVALPVGRGPSWNTWPR